MAEADAAARSAAGRGGPDLTPDPEEFTRPSSAAQRRSRARERYSRGAVATKARARSARGGQAGATEISAEERDALIGSLFAENRCKSGSRVQARCGALPGLSLRCRISRVPGPALSLTHSAARWPFARSASMPRRRKARIGPRRLGWPTGSRKTCRRYPDVAQAALRGLPCPSDAMIARAYERIRPVAHGDCSVFRREGLVVVHAGFLGKRIVAFPTSARKRAPATPMPRHGRFNARGRQ